MIINNWGLFERDDDDERNRLFVVLFFSILISETDGGLYDEVVVFVVVDRATLNAGCIVWRVF